jgi:D-lactate dehydrogenase
MLAVFFYEAFQEEEQALRRYLNPKLKVGFTWQTIQEAGSVQPPAALISIRTQSIIPPAWGTQLSGLLTRSTGYDHLHHYLAQGQGNFPCGYLPLYCHRAVAEHTLLLWLTLLRKLPQQLQQFHTFTRDGLTGQECQSKTLLVVGVGQIGYEVITIGRGLGMQVLGVDIEKKHADVTYVALEPGLSQADVVVCAMNLTADNQNYFNYSVLKQGKPGMIFINVARGEMSPSADLLRLLDEQFLGGVALDVYDNESELATSLRCGQITSSQPHFAAALELAKRPNVILTPHNAFNTQEAVTRKAEHSVQQIQAFLATGQFIWSVPPL